MENKYFEISWNSLGRVLVFVVALFLVYLIRDILIVLFSAIIISAVCRPFIDFLAKKRIPRFLGASLVFILILGILGIFLWLVVPLIISQFGDFIVNFDEIILKIGQNKFLEQLIRQLTVNLKAILDALTKEAAAIFNLVFSVFGGIFLTITCLVLAFYLAFQEKGIENFFRILLPQKYEKRIIQVFEKSSARINHWFRGRLILSLVVGLISFVGLYFMGIKHSGTLALLNAVLDIIPLIGPIFAGLIAFLVAAADSPQLGILVILLFIIIQQLANNLFAPLIIGKTTGLHPIIVLIAFLIGAKIAGLAGFILAVPVAIIIQEIFRVWENSTSPQP